MSPGFVSCSQQDAERGSSFFGHKPPLPEKQSTVSLLQYVFALDAAGLRAEILRMNEVWRALAMLGLSLVIAKSCLWLLKRWMERRTLRMIEEFKVAFPGTCMICSMARYGARELGTDEWPPEAHDCIEARTSSGGPG
jgi:hypothetical protein